ncbi:MAG: hypothetical protein WC623_21195 [Pedobacter sp.]|uniref:hypothetical protein n=1 Tax=Pedobacter sp. TaxID=1411316 RepID=UPI0035677B1B
MKTNIINLFKTSIAVCLLIICSINTDAQVGKKLTRHKSEDPMAGKVKPIITSPAAGATIDGPFVMVGKAEPNTAINIYVTPSYTLPKSPDGKPILVVSTPKHRGQHFNAKADANGVWQSPLIEVMFDSKTTERRIVVFVNQIWGSYTYTSKHIDYWASPKLTMMMETVKMPLKSNK